MVLVFGTERVIDMVGFHGIFNSWFYSLFRVLF